MASFNSTHIHLVKPEHPKPQQSLEPKNVAAETLSVVRECREYLFGYRVEAEVIVTQMGGLLDRLEAAAIRDMKQKRG